MKTVTFVRIAGIEVIVEQVGQATEVADDSEATLPVPGTMSQAEPGEVSRPTWFGTNWEAAAAFLLG